MSQIRGSAKFRLAIVISHPVQHFTTFYRALAENEGLTLRVFFCSRVGLEDYFDEEMNTILSWSMDLLSGYDSVFLSESVRIKRVSPLKVNNPSIAGELARFRPDVVLTYGYNQMTQLRTLWWSRRNQVPVMLIGDSENLHNRKFIRRFAKKIILRLLLRQYRSFLTVGDNNETYYRSYGVSSSKLFRSPLTIDEATFRVARQNRQALRQVFRAENGIGNQEIVVLFVGKLSERKRPGDLLDAIEKIGSEAKQSDATVRVVFAGNGTLMEKLLARAAVNSLPVTFLGFVNVDKLPQVYCGVDMLVHPSEYDPHPLVCSEAACVGLPMVLSDRIGAIGPTDIARNGQNAITFPCGDVQSLSRQIRLLAREPDLRARMERESLRVFDELDKNRSVSGLMAAIEFCLERNGTVKSNEARTP